MENQHLQVGFGSVAVYHEVKVCFRVEVPSIDVKMSLTHSIDCSIERKANEDKNYSKLGSRSGESAFAIGLWKCSCVP